MSTAALALLALWPLLQDPADPVVARFRLPDGKPAVVTVSQLAREVAVRHRRTPRGEEAVKFLVDLELVSVEARAAGVDPSPAELDRRVEQIGAELAAQGITLAAFLESKRMSVEDFKERYLALEIAHRRLVMRALELADPSEVTPELLQLWLEEARVRHTVITDEAELPDGIVAIVDKRRFDLVDLGRALLPNVPDEEREKYVRRIVLRDLLQWEADRAGIVVTQEDTRAEIERRRERIEGDPRYRGISYADWLRTTQGMTVDELARSDHMVATVQQQRLVDAEFSQEDLENKLREERESVLRRHGEKRELSIILLRAVEEPNQIVTRTFAEAREELERVRRMLDEGQSFRRLAQIHSDDPYSKVRGGALGQFARAASELPEDVLATAFAMEPLEVSEPIRVPQGMVLVRVTKVIPPPDDDALVEALREEVAQDYLAQRLEAAGIEIVR